MCWLVVEGTQYNKAGNGAQVQQKKKGGMALAAAWVMWVGVVAADKVGHGVKICDSQAKP